MASKGPEAGTSEPEKPKVNKKTGPALCLIRSPGPKYLLKPLVGYKDHCLSKERGPAFSLYPPFRLLEKCRTPGPSHYYELPLKGGYTFGHRSYYSDATCSPGPKYVLPSEKGPAFRFGIRTKPRADCVSPGGYDCRLPIPGPAFTIGRRLPHLKCDPTPMGKFYSDKLTKPSSPMFTFYQSRPLKEVCASPGPKYFPKGPKPTPVFTFGMKHNECSLPYITECDDNC
ncbi:outer dense fiber protein 3-like [Ceratina calcarata]|uniref:Outer dense fiber protein 3-like n=1 Tax=Ceratina calcarata TaxID=156304 RepID=A0AAJ7NFM8_9HYME|nr:outer dense fiber protein 3-like [Ceratina calcarata]